MIIKSITIRRGQSFGGPGSTRKGEPFDVKIEADSVYGLLTITPNEFDTSALVELVKEAASKIAQSAIEGMFYSTGDDALKTGGAA